MKELISIILPNYNAAQFIAETIESVLSQTYTEWELLIVDDKSTDDSLEIIKTYLEKDARIYLFENEVNRGAAYTRNVALKKAKGKWIAFLDSDDLWMPQKLEKQVAFMKQNDYKFSYTEYSQIDEESKPLHEVITGPKKVTKRKLFRYNYLGCLTVMYDRETMGLIQVDERIGNGRNDYALFLSASKKAPCYLLKEVLAQYRIRKISLSHGSFKKLLRYQYQLFRISEDMCWIRAWYHVAINLFFGAIKKIFYRKKLKKN